MGITGGGGVGVIKHSKVTLVLSGGVGITGGGRVGVIKHSEVTLVLSGGVGITGGGGVGGGVSPTCLLVSFVISSSCERSPDAANVWSL